MYVQCEFCGDQIEQDDIINHTFSSHPEAVDVDTVECGAANEPLQTYETKIAGYYAMLRQEVEQAGASHEIIVGGFGVTRKAVDRWYAEHGAGTVVIGGLYDVLASIFPCG